MRSAWDRTVACSGSAMQNDRPVIFLLHGLGGSARTFDDVAERLLPDFEPAAIDLPGFGDAANAVDTSIPATADAVAAAIRRRAARRWLLVGHSMGGKIASVVAARSLAGEPGLSGLRGVVLLAGSPPSPEPMDESRRQEMMGWVAHGPMAESSARKFIADNTGAPLPPSENESAIGDLMRTSPNAWLAWLDRGSREDWSETVGVVELPALVVVGSEDGDLGEVGQRATNCHIYPRARLLSEAGAGHLLPFERPDAVAKAIKRFWIDEVGAIDWP